MQNKVLGKGESTHSSNFAKNFTVRNIFTFSSLNYLQAGISFIVSILLARNLGTEDYGHYTYGLVFANILVIIMQFGADKTLVRDLVQLKFPDAVLSASVIIWIAIGVCAIAGIAVWSFSIAKLEQFAAWTVFLCALGGAAQGLTVAPWFDFKGKMNLQSLYGVIGRFIFLIGSLLILFIFNNEDAVVWVAGVLFFSRFVSLVLEWNYIRKSAQILYRQALPYLRSIIRNNTWVWLAAIGNLLMTQANQIILKDQGGATELAYFGLAFQVIMLIRLLQQQIVRLVAPSIANITHAQELTPKKVVQSLRKYCITSFLASSILLIPLYISTPWIVREFIGANYIPAVPVMNTLYVWCALYGIALINNQFLIGLRREKAFFRITLIFGLFSLVLAFVFIDRFQAQGAAFSLLVAHMGSILCQFLIVIRTIKLYTHDTEDIQKSI